MTVDGSYPGTRRIEYNLHHGDSVVVRYLTVCSCSALLELKSPAWGNRVPKNDVAQELVIYGMWYVFAIGRAGVDGFL